MMAGYATDMTTTVGWICKMRNFVLYSARTITLWSIALATIDRWLASSTNVSRRQTSSIRNARRSVVLVHIYACVINSPILYCYEANLSDALRGCYGLTYICRLITDLIYTIMTTLVPLLMMIIFGLLTIRHVRHTQNRIENITMVDMSYKNKNTLPTSTTRERSKKKVDKHLCKMLTVQVTLFVILTCPHGIQKSYSSIISSNEPSSQSLKNAVETFIFNLVTLLNFTASGIPFYIYTLAGGSLFRNTFYTI
ncbi:hypothetical protein I4U23_003874 [Adineta vaga]|nr:hypothetical protein I4U23_003874 [Adineta vaga]